MNKPGLDGMWDEEDGFYYDLLRLPDGTATRLKVRSVVGLLPLAATTIIEPWQRERIPRTHPPSAGSGQADTWPPEVVASYGEGHLGMGERRIIALLNPDKLRQILGRMLDENEFLSPYGIRSLSKYHQDHPYVFNVGGHEYRVDYLPAESNTGLFGGNSNWRGPVWFPVNAVIIRTLMQFHLYYGNNFKIECPTGSGRMMNLFEVAKEIVETVDENLPPRRAWPQARLWRHGEVPDRPPLARPRSVLRVLPRRQWRRPWREPSDWMDRIGRSAD